MSLALAPEMGGALLSLAFAGQDVLRPTPNDATDVVETACFSLVPYANRIAHGRFDFGGRTATIAPNMPGQAHPLHGEGWREPWTVEARGPTSAVLALEPAASVWPWAYRARQTVGLAASSLTLELEVTNLDAAPGPFGLGWHPFFPHAATARLKASTDGAWMVDAERLPTAWAAGAPLANWRAGAAVRGHGPIDHCHTGWTGTACIDLGPNRPSVRLSASPELGWLHVFAPPGEPYFCVEPVSHAPNALNMADPEAQGVRRLAPAETLRAWMRLDISV